MNATTQVLIDGLTDGVADCICLPVAELASGFDLSASQHISVLATAVQHGQTLALLFCESDDVEAEFVLTYQSEEDVLLDFSGPYVSYQEAQAAAGAVPGGWTEN